MAVEFARGVELNKWGIHAAVGLAVASGILAGCDSAGRSPGPVTDRPSATATATSSSTSVPSSRPGGAEVNTTATQDKCTIVSAAAATSAVGGILVGETAGRSGVGNPVCTFQFARTAFSGDATISLSTNNSGNRAMFLSTKSQFESAISIVGLADDAFFVRKTSTLELIKGVRIVIIQANVRRVGASGSVTTAAQTVLIKLARAALAQ